MPSFPEPTLRALLQLTVLTGEPAVIGGLATGGVRRNVPILGGSLSGGGLAATLLPGHGGEVWLQRSDGVAVVESQYVARTDKGDPLRVLATGYVTQAPEYAGTQLTFLFEVDEAGPLAWLATRVFVGRRAAGSDVFHIAIVE